MGDSRKKIVHLCLSSFYIDNFSYQENLIPKYNRLAGNDVTVIASLVSFDNRGKPCLLKEANEYTSESNFKVIRLNYNRKFYILSKYIRKYEFLYDHLVNEKPDILFIHDFIFYDIFTVIRYLKEHKYVKVYVDCHTDFINSGQTWFSRNILHKKVWRFIGSKLLDPYVTKYYGTTPLRSSFLENVYKLPKEKIEYLEMGIDDSLIEKLSSKKEQKKALLESYKIPIRNKLITTGGKIDSLKNIHLLIDLFLDKKIPQATLLVFGIFSHELEFYKEKINKSENIIYIGWLSPQEILKMFSMSDLVIFPGTHSVLWEQVVALGVPAVFKYWKGMTHVDIGGNCKFLKDVSYVEIEKTLITILEDDELAEMQSRAQSPKRKKFYYSEISKKAISNES